MFRNMFMLCSDSSTSNPSLVLSLADVIGPAPNPANNSVLQEALRELNSMIGWTQIKQNIRRILNLVQENYESQLLSDGPPPRNVPLNRLFLGNPGTGKTTAARLYGKILGASGILSLGGVVEKRASDFMGQAVGESQKLTKGILDSALGKVLLIDEVT